MGLQRKSPFWIVRITLVNFQEKNFLRLKNIILKAQYLILFAIRHFIKMINQNLLNWNEIELNTAWLRFQCHWEKLHLQHSDSSQLRRISENTFGGSKDSAFFRIHKLDQWKVQVGESLAGRKLLLESFWISQI
jgi:hypothetical protein